MRLAIPNEANAHAFLDLIAWSEGTAREPDPYRVVVGYGYVIRDLSDHPCVTGEWSGLRLRDEVCRRAGLKPPCKSTAAGAYQIIRPTWVRLKAMLALPSFEPDCQDIAAWGLLEYRRAVPDILAGRIERAIARASAEWASLPGNKAGQRQHKMQELVGVYETSGGVLA